LVFIASYHLSTPYCSLKVYLYRSRCGSGRQTISWNWFLAVFAARSPKNAQRLWKNGVVFIAVCVPVCEYLCVAK